MRNTPLARIVTSLTFTCTLASGACTHAPAAQGAVPAVDRETALATALARAPGTPDAGELEDENGHRVWSFDIRGADGTITEVQVDSASGAIVAVENETAEHEAEEAKGEAGEADAGR